MALLHGYSRWLFRSITESFERGEMGIAEYAQAVEPIVVSAEPSGPEVEALAYRFVNRVEEIRFTLPPETQAKAIRQESLWLDSIENEKQKTDLVRAAHEIIRKMLADQGHDLAAWSGEIDQISLEDEAYFEKTSIWRLKFSYHWTPARTVQLPVNQAVSDILDSDDDVAGEIRISSSSPTEIIMDVLWWGPTQPLGLPSPRQVQKVSSRAGSEMPEGPRPAD